MSTAVGSLRRIRILFSGESSDIAVPAHMSVRETLTTLGIPGWQDVAILDAGGRPVRADSTVGQACRDGAILAVLDVTAGVGIGGPGPDRRGGARGAKRAMSLSLVGLVAACALSIGCAVVAAMGAGSVELIAAGVGLMMAGLGLALVGGMSSGNRGPGAGSGPPGAGIPRSSAVGTSAWTRWSSAASTGAGTRWSSAASTGATIAAPIVAAAGTITVSITAIHTGLIPVPAGFDHALAFASGLSAGAIVSVGHYAVRRRAGREASAGVIAICWIVLAGLDIATLVAGLPLSAAAALLAGFAPLALRILPAGSLAVPPEELLDVDRFSATAPTLRTPQPAPVTDVAGAIVRAHERMLTGTVAISILTACGIAGLWAGASADRPLERWAGVAVSIAVALALWAHPRRAGDLVSRLAPRLSAAVIVLIVAGAFRGVGQVAAGVLGLGLMIAVLAIPISRGRRSVAWSRIADGIEMLATVVAMPAGVVAAGAIEAIRVALAQ